MHGLKQGRTRNLLSSRAESAAAEAEKPPNSPHPSPPPPLAPHLFLLSWAPEFSLLPCPELRRGAGAAWKDGGQGQGEETLLEKHG